jgi:hypothetical protein
MGLVVVFRSPLRRNNRTTKPVGGSWQIEIEQLMTEKVDAFHLRIKEGGAEYFHLLIDLFRRAYPRCLVVKAATIEH